MFGRREDRRFERFMVDGEVELRVLFTRTDDVKAVKAKLVNVGEGGLFVETPEDMPLGALADVNLKINGAPLANTLGLIRWLRPGEGAGIEFFYATDEEKRALDDYLEIWLREQRRGASSRG